VQRVQQELLEQSDPREQRVQQDQQAQRVRQDQQEERVQQDQQAQLEPMGLPDQQAQLAQ
jgi:hypothetical protein